VGRVCSTNGEKRNAYRILVGKPEGKRPLGRPRRRWEYNIRMYLREKVWGGMDWIDLAQDGDQWRALENTVMNLRVQLVRESWESLEIAGVLGFLKNPSEFRVVTPRIQMYRK
jgi:hypothetical protein